MHACEAAGIADLGRWHALPRWVQDEWLGHAYARLTGRYEPPPKTPRGKGNRTPAADPAILHEIERRRSAL